MPLAMLFLMLALSVSGLTTLSSQECFENKISTYTVEYRDPNQIDAPNIKTFQSKEAGNITIVCRGRDCLVLGKEDGKRETDVNSGTVVKFYKFDLRVPCFEKVREELRPTYGDVGFYTD